MLIHSYLYYVLDSPVVSDDVWQRWANELTKLQANDPKFIDFYDEDFKEWDGSTGMHLSQDLWVRDKALSLAKSIDNLNIKERHLYGF